MRHTAPSDWALSSITFKPCSFATAVSAAISHGCPNRWTGMTTRVRSDTSRATLAGSILKVRGSTSAKTGTPPSSSTVSATAANAKAGTMTSSPRCSPTASSDNRSASVPLPQAMQCRTSSSRASSSSNSPTAGPLMKAVSAMTSPMARSTSSRMPRYCLCRSTIFIAPVLFSHHLCKFRSSG